MVAPDDPTRASDPPSPCIGVCQMDGRTALCLGCLRTMEEIRLWAVLPVSERRRVLSELPTRGLARD